MGRVRVEVSGKGESRLSESVRENLVTSYVTSRGTRWAVRSEGERWAGESRQSFVIRHSFEVRGPQSFCHAYMSRVIAGHGEGAQIKCVFLPFGAASVHVITQSLLIHKCKISIVCPRLTKLFQARLDFDQALAGARLPSRDLK
jgi:hypothetical protein